MIFELSVAPVQQAQIERPGGSWWDGAIRHLPETRFYKQAWLLKKEPKQ
jgi:hypothetical protein